MKPTLFSFVIVILLVLGYGRLSIAQSEEQKTQETVLKVEMQGTEVSLSLASANKLLDTIGRQSTSVWHLSRADCMNLAAAMLECEIGTGPNKLAKSVGQMITVVYRRDDIYEGETDGLFLNQKIVKPLISELKKTDSRGRDIFLSALHQILMSTESINENNKSELASTLLSMLTNANSATCISAAKNVCAYPRLVQNSELKIIRAFLFNLKALQESHDWGLFSLTGKQRELAEHKLAVLCSIPVDDKLLANELFEYLRYVFWRGNELSRVKVNHRDSVGGAILINGVAKLFPKLSSTNRKFALAYLAYSLQDMSFCYEVGGGADYPTQHWGLQAIERVKIHFSKQEEQHILRCLGMEKPCFCCVPFSTGRLNRWLNALRNWKLNFWTKLNSRVIAPAPPKN